MELKCIINTLVTICAQSTGIQGVKLIKSVIQPDSLHDPSRAQDREDQCVKITYLKEQLRRKLLHGEPESYEWKWARQTPYPLQNNFIDLLCSENYREVLMSCQAWLKETTEYLYPENDEINVFREREYQQNMTTKSLENSLLQHLEDQMLEEASDVEVRSIKVMAKVISILYQKLDANHNEVLGKVDEMRKELHQEFQCLRKYVITNIEKSLGKLLRLAMENEVEKQLPRVVFLTTIDDKNIKKFVTSMLGISLVEIHFYCEDVTLPHPVDNQPGIALTSWLQSHQDRLEKALPYINGFFVVLTKAIGLGINSGGLLIPDWTPNLKLSNDYSIISRIMKSEFDAKQSFKEWQKCLASILAENGGVTDENIYKKFCLRRVINDNKVDRGNQVAWLCKTHYEAQRPFPLN